MQNNTTRSKKKKNPRGCWHQSVLLFNVTLFLISFLLMCVIATSLKGIELFWGAIATGEMRVRMLVQTGMCFICLICNGRWAHSASLPFWLHLEESTLLLVPVKESLDFIGRNMISLLINTDGRRQILCSRGVLFWRMLIPDELVQFEHECEKKWW